MEVAIPQCEVAQVVNCNELGGYIGVQHKPGVTGISTREIKGKENLEGGDMSHYTPEAAFWASRNSPWELWTPPCSER